MNKIKLVSVIVAIYKDIESLDLIIKSLQNQTYNGEYEIIIAEDGEDINVSNYINSLAYTNISHTTQKDEGWRKNKSLNNAIINSKGNLLIFLDGDCIPYSNLVENYVLKQEKKTVLCGRRVELGAQYTNNIRNFTLSSIKLEKNYFFNIVGLLKDNTRHYEEGIVLNNYFYNLKFKNKTSHILGCNFAVNREDIYSINGFNEDYHWASVGEDTDIEYRLMKINCKMKPVRNLCNVFHLYHKESYSAESNQNSMNIFNKIKETDIIYCKNGLNKE